MVNYFLFAFKNLKKRGLRSYLTLLGIFIGIAAVISLITLGNGLKLAVNSQFGVGSTQVISVQAGGLAFGPPGSFVVTPLIRDDAEAISRLSSVDFVISNNIETSKVEYNDRIVISAALSIDEGLEEYAYEINDLQAESGRLLKSSDSKKVILGNNFKDPAKNGFQKEVLVGKKILIQDEEFSVVGILEKKGSFFLDGTVFMHNRDLEELADYGDNVDSISVKVKSKDLMQRAEEDIEKLLRERRDVKLGEENFEVSTPEATLEQVNSILSGIQIFVIIIASISIFVGAIGIINTMTTSVLERKREIGIMKAIGAKNKHVFFEFFVESGMLGLVGGVLGIIFGLLIGSVGITALNSFLGSTTQPEINIPLIIFSLFGSFLIGAIAGIIPAMRAARQNPVDALRG